MVFKVMAVNCYMTPSVSIAMLHLSGLLGYPFMAHNVFKLVERL